MACVTSPTAISEFSDRSWQRQQKTSLIVPCPEHQERSGCGPRRSSLRRSLECSVGPRPDVHYRPVAMRESVRPSGAEAALGTRGPGPWRSECRSRCPPPRGGSSKQDRTDASFSSVELGSAVRSPASGTSAGSTPLASRWPPSVWSSGSWRRPGWSPILPSDLESPAAALRHDCG
jgi:hypothetical protein